MQVPELIRGRFDLLKNPEEIEVLTKVLPFLGEPLQQPCLNKLGEFLACLIRQSFDNASI
jgi:hypothetical protein